MKRTKEWALTASLFPKSLIAPASVLICVAVHQADASAASFTINGFTGAFAPSEWVIDNASGGTIQITPTEATFKLPATQGAAASMIFDTSKLNATYPGFTQGSVRFNWTWKSSLGTTTPFFASDLERQINSTNPVILTKYNGPTPPTILDVANIANFTTSATGASFNVVAGDVFVFRLDSVAIPFDSSEAIISGFSFNGTTSQIPGPLPVMGAAAAFSFARRIRKKLNAKADYRA